MVEYPGMGNGRCWRMEYLIIVYTLKTCPKCHVIVEFLRRENFRFKEVDAMDHVGELTNMGLFTLPIIKIGGTYRSIHSIDELISTIE